MNNKQPTRSNDVVLHQILKLIPRGMVGRIARETGVDAKARSFSVPSHLAAMLFAQLTHAIGLNDVCDWLRMKAAVLARHGLGAPSRNGLSHANKQRDALFMEKLFWEQLAHLQHIISPSKKPSSPRDPENRNHHPPPDEEDASSNQGCAALLPWFLVPRGCL